jgi:hypothetical protein
MDTPVGLWLRSITGQETQQGIADHLGVDRATIYRWLKSGINIEAVINSARTCGTDPIQGLVTLGFLKKEESERHCAVGRASQMTLTMLLTEALDRAREIERDGVG